MDFAGFADQLRDIEETASDTGTTTAVADLLVAADAELPTVARFLLGRVFPAHESTTLDVGPRLCYAAIARAAGQNVSADDVEARLADIGDIGEVAASYDFGGQQGLSAFGGGGEDTLTVGELDRQLRELATASGTGSQDTKLDSSLGCSTAPTGPRHGTLHDWSSRRCASASARGRFGTQSPRRSASPSRPSSVHCRSRTITASSR